MTIFISILGGLLAAGLVVFGLALVIGCGRADAAADELRRLRGDERTDVGKGGGL